ncbi:hypothetical protein [Tractidigestivibacter scatoligenes]|nr:hypothetical protein [Tractidigestivibacter scatoligenes]
MRDWARCEADIVRLLSKHFTPGRSGARIQHVVVHYNDADGSVEDVWD